MLKRENVITYSKPDAYDYCVTKITVDNRKIIVWSNRNSSLRNFDILLLRLVDNKQ